MYHFLKYLLCSCPLKKQCFVIPVHSIRQSNVILLVVYPANYRPEAGSLELSLVSLFVEVINSHFWHMSLRTVLVLRSTSTVKQQDLIPWSSRSSRIKRRTQKSFFIPFFPSLFYFLLHCTHLSHFLQWYQLISSLSQHSAMMWMNDEKYPTDEELQRVPHKSHTEE